MSASGSGAGSGTEETAELAVVEAHLTAFNRRDIDAVMAGFDTDAVFTMAAQLIVGARAIRQAFADSFAVDARARLDLQRAVVEGDTVACELTERIEAQGITHSLDVAAFYTVRNGLLARVRIYRDLVG